MNSIGLCASGLFFIAANYWWEDYYFLSFAFIFVGAYLFGNSIGNSI